MKLALGDGMKILLKQIVNATKEASEETRKELTPMKKTLTDIEGVVNRDAEASKPPGPQRKKVGNIFGIYTGKDRQLHMGSTLVEYNVREETLTVDGREYKLTPGLLVLIQAEVPQETQYTGNDLKEYEKVVRKTKVRSFPNPNMKGDSDPHDTWNIHIYPRICLKMLMTLVVRNLTLLK